MKLTSREYRKDMRVEEQKGVGNTYELAHALAKGGFIEMFAYTPVHIYI